MASFLGFYLADLNCPNADNDRIAANRANSSLQSGKHLNDISAETLAHNLRTNGRGERNNTLRG